MKHWLNLTEKGRGKHCLQQAVWQDNGINTLEIKQLRKRSNPAANVLLPQLRQYAGTLGAMPGSVPSRNRLTKFNLNHLPYGIEGEKGQEEMKALKVAGIGVLAVTGLAIGAVGAANRFGTNQMIRDNLSL